MTVVFAVIPQTNVSENVSGPMDDLDSEWQRKGATLSDKTAREVFGLTQDEIVRAIRGGKLQYREGSMYGNPWLRLLRCEVDETSKLKRQRAPGRPKWLSRTSPRKQISR